MNKTDDEIIKDFKNQIVDDCFNLVNFDRKPIENRVYTIRKLLKTNK